MSIDSFTKLLADDGHQIMIFCPFGGRFKDKKYPNIGVKRYLSITAPSYKDMQLALPFIWTAVRDLKEFNPDVVHIQTPLGIGWIGIWAAKILKMPNIQTYHTYIPDFLVYLKPKTLLGFNKITDYINNSKITKTLAGIDILEDNETIAKFRAKLNKIVDEITDTDVKNSSSKLDERFGRDYTRVVYNRADLVLTPSLAMKKVLKQQGIKTEVDVMSNGVRYDFFKKKTDYHVTNRIVYIGRLGHEKNVDVVIKAFNIAATSRPELRLDIYGDGPAKSTLQSLVKSFGIGNKIKFLGAYDINKVSQKLYEYDFFATASTVETQGIVILEAMASGLPVLGVNKLAVPEVVKNGKNGYISEPFDEVGMAKNMLKLLESDKKIEQFSQKSLEIAKSHEISKCKNRLLWVYESMANKQ